MTKSIKFTISLIAIITTAITAYSQVAVVYHAQYNTAVTATNVTLVVSNRSHVVRTTLVVINNGTSDGWLLRSATGSTNGMPLKAGMYYSPNTPQISSGIAQFVDNDPYYFWSTNTCNIHVTEEMAQ
jgi:hypothetical protein